MNQVNALHLRALRLAKRYRQMEASLLDVLSKMMELGAFEKLGYANAYQYCTEGLRLSESQSYALVGIARKAKEVPELKTQIENGAIHLTNARRIVPLLTRENQDTWLEKAATLSLRQLEREIVREFPKLEAPERIRPLSAERSELRVGISLELEAKLAKIKDLLSRKLGKAADLEAALNAMADTYLQKNDPIAKAARQELVALPKPVAALRDGRRVAIPAALGHALALRDQNRCTALLPNGKRCPESRWLERHHPMRVAHGGHHALSNLTTLCTGHHRGTHGQENRLKLSKL